MNQVKLFAEYCPHTWSNRCARQTLSQYIVFIKESPGTEGKITQLEAAILDINNSRCFGCPNKMTLEDVCSKTI